MKFYPGDFYQNLKKIHVWLKSLHEGLHKFMISHWILLG